MDKKKLLTWAIFFLLLSLTFQFVFKKQTNTGDAQTPVAPIVVEVTKDEYIVGEEVRINVKNNTENPIEIPATCPKNPLKVLKYTESSQSFTEISADSNVDCALVPAVTIAKAAEQIVTFKYWNHALFGIPGRYKVEFITGDQTVASPEFRVEPAGIFRQLFRTIFYQPIYNLLVLLISFAPYKDLGFAIILLTLIIRLILLVPSQRAIVSQRRMQELQPKLEEVKKQYAGNQERIAQETMKLWKQHKVNPFGSCLPMLIQFPVLIALYYVISSGLNPDNAYLVYAPLKNVDLLNLHTNFLGILDLTKVDKIVLPLIVGLLQFAQMKLSMAKKKPTHGQTNEMETANKTMVYILPVMIAVFTASAPAGVGLYWGVSTLFGIGQQWIANSHVSKTVVN